MASKYPQHERNTVKFKKNQQLLAVTFVTSTFMMITTIKMMTKTMITLMIQMTVSIMKVMSDHS